MSDHTVGCILCGSPLEYGIPRLRNCSICGGGFVSNASCTKGHFVCDRCHSKKGIISVNEICQMSESTNPFTIAVDCMNNSDTHMHGPEHHMIVGAAIIAACRNSGMRIDLPSALEEMSRRSAQVPGGACGYWGCCGAAVSTGIALSIILKATPLSEREWGLCNRLTGQCLQKIGELGGPRCCKRDSFTALDIAIRFLRDNGIAELQSQGTIDCSFFSRNAQCIGNRCPYHQSH